MKVIKRDGSIVDYNSEKISTAIGKANSEVKPKERASKEQINEIKAVVNDRKTNIYQHIKFAN